MSPPPLKTRERLSEVRYEIRGELARRARELEAQGRAPIKLHIGNPGVFGFRAPDHLQRAIADRIERTDPYVHQQGLPAAREAIAACHKRRKPVLTSNQVTLWGLLRTLGRQTAIAGFGRLLAG